MFDLFCGLLPGSVFIRRYSVRSVYPQIIGLFLMELAPYLLVAYFLRLGMLGAIFGFLYLYSFYEFGYLHNDIVAANKESVGSSKRSAFNNFNLPAFLIGRFSIIVLLTDYVLFDLQYKITIMVALNLVLLCFCFWLHNTILNVKYRLGTFIYLNFGKIAFRLFFMDVSALYYLVSFTPHIIIKAIEYLRSKQIVSFDVENFAHIKALTYIPILLIFCLYDWHLATILLPLFLNHCKVQLISLLKMVKKSAF